MKKIITILLVVVLAFSCMLALTACGGEVVEGSYKYENTWTPGTYYGVKVSVKVDGDKIKSVELAEDSETGLISVSSGWTDKAIWEDGIDDFLASFKKLSVSQVKNVKVECGVTGQPDKVTGMDYITGSTQGSGRVILAVQNALGVKVNTTYFGEYKYENTWTPGNYYGAKAHVAVCDGKIVSVKLDGDKDDGSYVNLSPSWADKDLWENGSASFLSSFVGKTFAEVNAIKVECSATGQPSTVTGFNYVTGSTQSSGRTILAIQEALKKAE